MVFSFIAYKMPLKKIEIISNKVFWFSYKLKSIKWIVSKYQKSIKSDGFLFGINSNSCSLILNILLRIFHNWKTELASLFLLYNKEKIFKEINRDNIKFGILGFI